MKKIKFLLLSTLIVLIFLFVVFVVLIAKIASSKFGYITIQGEDYNSLLYLERPQLLIWTIILLIFSAIAIATLTTVICIVFTEDVNAYSKRKAAERTARRKAKAEKKKAAIERELAALNTPEENEFSEK